MKCDFITPQLTKVWRKQPSHGIRDKGSGSLSTRKNPFNRAFLTMGAILFFGLSQSFSQNWDAGGGDGNWLNPINYAGNVLPMAGGIVIVPNGATPYPANGLGALSFLRLDIAPGAVATVPSGLTLTLVGTGASFALRVQEGSIFTNLNVINITNYVNGILVRGGTLNNNDEIRINDVSANGILNSPTAIGSPPSIINNTNQITIGNVGAGGQNGINNAGANGIAATFVNSPSGMITIGNVQDNGIRNSALNGPATLTNSAVIFVNANDAASINLTIGILNVNDAVFSNTSSTGSVQVENASSGIVNNNASFTSTNNAQIFINSLFPDDVRIGIVNNNDGFFVNSSGADISIQNTVLAGIRNANASFTNRDLGTTINTTNTGNEGINNVSPAALPITSFFNLDRAVINICQGGINNTMSAIYNEANSYFQNGNIGSGTGATINIASSGRHGVENAGDFVNTSFAAPLSQLNIGVAIGPCVGNIPIDGINNSGQFTNNTDSRISIRNFAQDGIENTEIFTNNNPFDPNTINRSQILITGSGGINGVNNDGSGTVFTVADNQSFLRIDGDLTNGFLNNNSASLINDNFGRVEIYAGTSNGFVNANLSIVTQTLQSDLAIEFPAPFPIGFLNDNSAFNNFGGSSLAVIGSNSVGFLQTAGAVVNNGNGTGTGSIFINFLVGGAAYVSNPLSFFFNNTCSVLSTDGQINNNSVFINNAIIETTYAGTNIGTVPITNNGIIIDYNNSFNSNLILRTPDATLVDNTLGIIAPPITICPDDPSVPGGSSMAKGALISNGPVTGKTFQTSPDWFNNPGLVAPPFASYSAATNILTIPSNPAPGTMFDLHFDVDGLGSGCQYNGRVMVMVDNLPTLAGEFTKLDNLGAQVGPTTTITGALNNPSSITLCSGTGVNFAGSIPGALVDKNGNPLFIHFVVNDPTGITGLPPVLNVPGALLPANFDLFPLINNNASTAVVGLTAIPYYESDGLPGLNSALECSGVPLGLNINIIPDPANFVTLTNTSGNNNQTRRVCSESGFAFNGTVSAFPAGVTGFRMQWTLTDITGPNGAFPFDYGQISVIASDCGQEIESQQGITQTINAAGNILFNGSDNDATPCAAPVLTLSDLAPHDRRVIYELTPIWILADGTECPSMLTPTEVRAIVYPKPQLELDNIAGPVNDNVMMQGAPIDICDNTSPNGLIQVRQYPTQVVEQSLASTNDMGDLEYDVQILVPVGVTLSASGTINNVGSDGTGVLKTDFISPLSGLPLFDNTTMSPQQVTIEVTPSFDPNNANAAGLPANTDPDGACAGTTQRIIVNVLPTPDLNPPLFTDVLNRIIDVTICGSDGPDPSELVQLFVMKNMNMAPYFVEFELFDIDLSGAPNVTRSTVAAGLPNGGHPNTTDNTNGLEVQTGGTFNEFLMNNGALTETIVYTFRPQIDISNPAETEICFGPTYELRVHILPKVFVSATLDGSEEVCQNHTRLVEGVPGPFPTHPGPWMHNWTIVSPQPVGFIGTGNFTDNNAAPGGQSSTSQTAAFTGVGNGMIRLSYTAKAANGCEAFQPFFLDLEVIPSPIANPITGPNVVCPSATATYLVSNPIIGNSYAWSISSGGTITTPPVGNTIDVTWSNVLGGPHTITVIETGPNSCTTSNTYTVNIVDMNDPGSMCPASITLNTSADGMPGDCLHEVNGTALDVVPSDNCGIASATHDYDFGGTSLDDEEFPLGATVVTWKVTDLSGNMSTCSFTITVVDNEFPVITCPSDVTVNTDGTGLNAGSQIGGVTLNTAPSCGIGLSNLKATATDNCGTANISWTASAGVSPLSGSGTLNNVTFPVGASTVTFTADDTHGQTSICSIQVVIFDNEKPVITCAANASFNTSGDAVPNFCGYRNTGFTLNPVSNTDNCAVAALNHNYQIGGSSLANFDFPLGSTTVVWTSTDNHGNTQTCSNVITVIDDEVPTVSSCPSNIVTTTDPGLCTDLVSYQTPVFNDNCGGMNVFGTLVLGQASNTQFPKGISTVRYEYRDPSGNGPAICQFTVTVNDGQVPVISCVPDVTVDNTGMNLNFDAFTYGVQVDDASNDCSVGFIGLNPVISDNCPGPYVLTHFITYPDGVVSPGNGTVNGMMFPGGKSTIVYRATDVAGNSSTCSFTIMVKDVEKPVITTCPSSVAINTSTNGTGDCSINIPNLVPGLVAMDNCTATANLTISQSPLAGTNFSGVHNSIQLVTFTVTDLSGNTSTCTANVTIIDNENPTAVCKPSFTIPLDDDGIVPLNVLDIDLASFDNCQLSTRSISVLQVTCAQAGTTVPVVLTVVDANGNSHQCTTIVLVRDQMVPTILNCPANIIVGNDPDMCMAFVNFSKVQASDNCDTNVDIYFWTTGATILGGSDILGLSGDGNPTNDPILGHAGARNYNFGVTTVHYVAVDNFGNVTPECVFTIEVKDVQKPIITKCAPSRDIFVNAGTCQGTVPNMIAEIENKDNCITVVTQVPAAGTLFGNAHNFMQLVTFTVTDQGGNTVTCTATLTLKDNILPVIVTCPPSRNISTNLNVCNGTVPNLLPELVATDNCTIVSITQSPIAGTLFGAANNDTQVVTFTVTDAAGNTRTCTSTLTLKDTQVPTITCPSDVTVGCSPPVVTIPAPTTGDNCGVVTVLNSFNNTNNASGIYPLGTTTVTWTVTDVNGNTATCTQRVTVGPLPIVTASGAGTYCYQGFISALTASSVTPGGQFSWFKNALLTVPVNPSQVSGSNGQIYQPTGSLGIETVYVIVTNPLNGCSSLPIPVTVNIIACGVTLTDPCACKNNATNQVNGQFDEIITITAPAGQNWYITSVSGLFRTISPAPPAAPIPFTTGPAGNKPVEGPAGQYVLTGIHVDAIGYSITFANGLGDTVSSANTCFYPNPVIVGLNSDYCANHPIVPLVGNALPQMGIGTFALYDATNTILLQNNITQLNPAQIAPGTYTVRFTFDGTNQPNTSTPGCVQTISQQVQFFPTPPSDLVCNNISNVSLDQNGEALLNADMILEGNYGCYSQYIVDIEGPLTNLFTCADVNKTFKVTVTDPFTGNKCWGSLKVEDKLKPTITCADVTVSCNNDGLDPSLVGFPIFDDNCSVDPATIKFSETISDPSCTGPWSAVITRTWNAKDEVGNQATPCVQTIFIKRATLAEVKFPLNLDDIQAPSLSCVNPNTTPANTGVPTIDGMPINKFCELMVAPAQDQIIPVCENSYKILRTWTVMDACSNNMITQVQTIFVKDKVGPIQICPNPSAFTYSVDGDGTTCKAIFQAPSIQVQDNCSSALNVVTKTSVTSNGIVYDKPTNGGIFEIGFGTITVKYTSTDACGNVSTCSVDVNVFENEPPVTVCDEFTVVSLINPITYVNASTFDDGSYDECGGPVKFQVRRMDNPACAGGDDTDFAPKVPFYCCDVNNGPVMIVLRVTDASGNFNDCMVEAKVNDKIKPVITCPADITLQCSDPIQPTDQANVNFKKTSGKTISMNFANAIEEQIVVSGLPASARIADVDFAMDLKHDFIDQLTIKLISPQGTVLTLFQGGSCGNTKKDINATFNDEGTNFACNGATIAVNGQVKPQVSEMSYVDKENPTGTWTLQVIDNAPLGGGVLNAIELKLTYSTPLSLKPIATDNAMDCGLITTFSDLTKLGQCLGGSFINRRWTATDLSGNFAQCIQKVNLIDNTPLDIDFPDDVTVTDCLSFDQVTGLGALKHTGDCEIVAVEIVDEIFNVVTDACYKVIRTYKVIDWCKYNPKATNNTLGGIDVDFTQFDFNPADNVVNNQFDNNKNIIRDNGDGYFEFKQIIKVIDTKAPQFYTCPKDTVIMSFAADCSNNPVSITKLGFDACAPQASLKYQWKVDISDNGNYDLNGVGPVFNGNLPLGKHHIWFRIEDGCGNYSICEYDITIVDAKKPSPVCANGLSTAIMVTGMVMINAEAFNKSSTDNCTAAEKLKFSFSPNVNDTIVTYTCDSLGSRPVQVWVTDEAGNQDFCETFILITDNFMVCGDTMDMITVGGKIQVGSNAGVSDVQVQLAGSGMPMVITNNTGNFNFPPMSLGGNYTLVPLKDTEPLNGVSTLDIIQITNHILGKKALGSPYKLIAADANRNNQISSSDLAQLRRLILHIIPNFKDNTSWRFVDKGFVFPKPTNPWSTAFPEVYDIKNLNSNMAINFEAIKIGDVTGDVKANAASPNEVRTLVDKVNFAVQEQNLVPGELVTVSFTAENFKNISGYQYTLNFEQDVLEYVSVTPGDVSGIGEENFGLSFLNNGLITTSWNGQEGLIPDGKTVFNMTFKVLKSSKLSKSLAITSDMTEAEAYTNEGEGLDLGLTFMNGKQEVDASFVLNQNVPNPFNNKTVIGFRMPIDGYAQLIVTDMAGKVVLMKDGTFNHGYNEFSIQRTELNASGIYYYQLNTDENSETKKLILIE